MASKIPIGFQDFRTYIDGRFLRSGLMRNVPQNGNNESRDVARGFWQLACVPSQHLQSSSHPVLLKSFSQPVREFAVMPIRNRRSTGRYEVSANTTCDFASPVLEDFGPVKVLNISATGVGLVTAEKVQLDLLFVVRLVNPTRKFVCMKLVQVMQVVVQADGTYLVGARFESPLSNDEFCALM